jgi:hypothetical protein
MPYSNQRRHNLLSIPQTSYQTLIIPCPNFDPIYQVILLENSNEWNLSSKRMILKKKRKKREKGREKENKKDQGLKSKRGETGYKEAPCFKRRKGKKKRMKFTSCCERFYRKKERKDITFSYTVKSDVLPHPYLYIICICTTFYSLTFPFLPPFTTSFSINHDYLPHKLSRIFLCFYNIQGVA